MIDTHAHLDGEEFAEDRAEVMARAKEAGVSKVLIPAIDYSSSVAVMQLCAQYPDFAFPMVGLHPEEVKDDWREELERIRIVILRSEECGARSEECGVRSEKCTEIQSSDLVETYTQSISHSTLHTPHSSLHTPHSSLHTPHSSLHTPHSSIIAIGEIGLDFYWSREYEKEQLAAFDEQVQWSIETGLPLMIHCRKGQNEMVHLLKQYERELPGGVFHCFTGNEREAADFLQFDRFVLGIGGVLTFKKSHLPEVLPASVPLDRIVLETDSPYMAPVPMRGKRNESAFVRFVLQKLAECYGVSEENVAEITNQTVYRIFPKLL